MKLCNLDLGWTIFNLPLNNIDVPVLHSHKFSLLDQFGVFGVELRINFIEHLGVFLLLEVFFPFLHPLELHVEALFLLFTLFLKLLLVFGKPCLLLD